MKKVDCRELTGFDCDFSYEGEGTPEEFMAAMQAHGDQVHADDLAKMSEEEKKEMKRRLDEILARQN